MKESHKKPIKANGVDAELKTKVPKTIADRFRSLVVANGSTPYEFLQNCVLLRLKYDMHQNYCEQPEIEDLFKVLSPIMDLEDPSTFRDGALNDIQLRAGKPGSSGAIKKVIVIREGGFTSEYTRKDESWLQCFDTDQSAFDLLTEGHPALKKDVKLAMQVLGFNSFSLFFRQMVNDIAPDVLTILRNKNSAGMTMSYGTVPVRHPNKRDSSATGFRSQKYHDSDYDFALEGMEEPNEDGDGIGKEIGSMFSDFSEGSEEGEDGEE